MVARDIAGQSCATDVLRKLTETTDAVDRVRTSESGRAVRSQRARAKIGKEHELFADLQINAKAPSRAIPEIAVDKSVCDLCLRYLRTRETDCTCARSCLWSKAVLRADALSSY